MVAAEAEGCPPWVRGELDVNYVEGSVGWLPSDLELGIVRVNEEGKRDAISIYRRRGGSMRAEGNDNKELMASTFKSLTDMDEVNQDGNQEGRSGRGLKKSLDVFKKGR